MGKEALRLENDGKREEEEEERGIGMVESKNVNVREYLRFLHYIEEHPLNFQLFGVTVDFLALGKSVVAMLATKFFVWLASED